MAFGSEGPGASAAVRGRQTSRMSSATRYRPRRPGPTPPFLSATVSTPADRGAPGNWKTGGTVAYYSAGATAERGAATKISPSSMGLPQSRSHMGGRSA